MVDKLFSAFFLSSLPLRPIAPYLLHVLCLIIMSIYHEEMNFLEVFHLNFVSECSARDEVHEFLCMPYIVYDYQEEWREIKKANKNSICNFFHLGLLSLSRWDILLKRKQTTIYKEEEEEEIGRKEGRRKCSHPTF